MAEDRVRVKFGVSENASGWVSFEPNGMSYQLEPGGFVFAELSLDQLAGLEIVYWDGGVSVWLPGNVDTFDRNGNMLHRLRS